MALYNSVLVLSACYLDKLLCNMSQFICEYMLLVPELHFQDPKVEFALRSVKYFAPTLTV
jgi:hypothetical protein